MTKRKTVEVSRGPLRSLFVAELTELLTMSSTFFGDAEDYGYDQHESGEEDYEGAYSEEEG